MNSVSNVKVFLLAGALVATLAVPALSSPNDHRFQKSSEGLKQAMVQTCNLMHDYLVIAEREADKRAGTKAAAPYSKQADEWWEAGVRNGCSWAK